MLYISSFDSHLASVSRYGQMKWAVYRSSNSLAHIRASRSFLTLALYLLSDGNFVHAIPLGALSRHIACYHQRLGHRYAHCIYARSSHVAHSEQKRFPLSLYRT